MRSLKALLLAAACLLAVQLVSSELPPFKEASLPCHRLPINVKPTKYELHLKFPSLDSDVYEGQVDIAVDFLKSKSKLLAAVGLKDVPCASQSDENTIVLHANKSLEIKDIKVTSEPYLRFVYGKQKELKITELVRDEANQMIAIKVKHGIYPSSHGTPGKVSITFKGRMRDDKRGVYFSTYNDGKQVYKHIVSQFQPTDARTVFPCFDEPRFRVPFSVRVTHPIGLTAYGNTEVHQVSDEGDLKSTLFATTPDMPVHMVAFTIGSFDEPLEVVSRHYNRDERKEIKIRVITEMGKRETGHFALEVAQRSLEWFENYIDYGFPLNKLDVIAIADHDKDNTETWGLVFVRDTLLWIDDETKQDTKITTAVNVAHVVVHQWFANLISANWWSDLWMTEGVAAQFSFNIVQDLYNNFKSEYFVRLATLSAVLQADQAGNLHPLSPLDENLRTSEQIYGIFDFLEFMKSGSMAQMIEETVGSFEYQKILRKLIKENAYKTINFKDYQRAVLSDGKSNINRLRDLLNTFPKYAGVPLVNCDVYWFIKPHYNIDHNRMRIQLEPFDKARDNVEEFLWPRERQVTIKVDTTIESGSSNNLALTKIISTDDDNHFNDRRLPWSYELKNDDFIKVDRNPSIATYYRTRYSEQLYDSLQGAIKNQFIPPMDRLQILDDANSLVQAGLIKVDRFKSLLDSYADEYNPAVVLAILVATNTYRALSPENVNSLQSNKAILSIFENFGFKVTGDDLILQRARQVVLTSLIKQGNEQAIAAALEAFDKADGRVALYLREPVYTAAVLSGSLERVNQLLSHLSETKSYEEQIRLLTALTLSSDKEVLTKVKSWLESSNLKAETIKPFLDSISAVLSQ